MSPTPRSRSPSMAWATNPSIDPARRGVPTQRRNGHGWNAVTAGLTQEFLVVSAGFWSLAFALYVIGNARILVTPRPDGREG